MHYQPLQKFYYSDKQLYEEKYKEYISGVSTVIFDFKIKEYPAFFVFCPEIGNLIGEIWELEKSLEKILRALPSIAQQQYAMNKLVDEIKLTNEIEGVQSTRKEIRDILSMKEGAKKGVRFYSLVEKYRRLMEHRKVQLDTCQDIRDLYDELVLPEVLLESKDDMPDGVVFRKHSVFIQNKRGDKIHEGLPTEEKIIDTMTKLLNILNKPEVNDLIAIAVMHYMIGYIHPFYNGNGRLNRFISSYLIAEKLHVLVSYAISGTIKQNRAAYDKIFKLTNDDINRGDLTSFIIYFLGLIKDTLAHLNQKIEERKTKLDFFREHLKKYVIGTTNSKKILNILLQNSLFGFEGMSVDMLSKICSVSPLTVRKILQQNKSIIKETKGEKRLILYDIDLNKIKD